MASFIFLLTGFAALIWLPYSQSQSKEDLLGCCFYPKIDLVFLNAVQTGDLPKLQKIVQMFENGEGPGKVPYAKLKTSTGYSALHFAAGLGKTDVCRFLIEKLNFDINGTVNRIGETPLLHAITVGQLHTLIFLIDNGANVTKPNSLGETPLHYAAMTGSMEIVKLLIAKGADLNAVSVGGSMPLHFAAKFGNCKVLEYLLSLGADPNAATLEQSPLLASVMAKSRECVEVLLKAGADPDRPCFLATPLRYAAVSSDIGIVRSLLEGGADPNKPDYMGYTALERAAMRRGRKEVVKLLFPATSPMARYPDWSILGVVLHALSEEAVMLFNSKLRKSVPVVKAKGDEAMQKKNYIDAADWYTQAAGVDRNDVQALLNRSLCYTKMFQGQAALADALASIELEPGLAVAHFREGEAWNILSDYKKAAEAFFSALGLDPGNKEIKTAYMVAQAKSDKFRHWKQY